MRRSLATVKFVAPQRPLLHTRRHLLCRSATLLSPDVIFQLHALPPHLRDEFDQAANQSSLRYLAKRRTSTAARGEAGTTPTVVEVLPSWAHKVTWSCGSCGGKWSARPVDRLDPQVKDHVRCPHCASAPIATATASVKASHHQDCSTDTMLRRSPSRAEGTRLLRDAYPTIAAQWDLHRNEHFQNRVMVPLTKVAVTATAKAWWRCSLCRRPWQETVAGRVARHEDAFAQRGGGGVSSGDGDESSKEFLSLCPSCERRGAMERLNTTHRGDKGSAPIGSGTHAVPHAKRCLADDPLLAAEARLRPDQSPAEISLHGETVISWHCRYCEYDFQASVAARYERHERCPQCSGRVQTPLNLLVLQRPDVVREVSKAISRTRLKHLTVHDDSVEIPFVCRTCLSAFRMTAKARCALPVGAIACPKCVLALSQTIAAAAPVQTPQLLGGDRSRREPVRSGRSRQEKGKIKAAAHRLSASGRSGERMEATRLQLQKRDTLLRN